MNWYIVQAYSGFEKKVVETIKDELKKNKLSENLEEILVPTHQVTEVKKGKRINFWKYLITVLFSFLVGLECVRQISRR